MVRTMLRTACAGLALATAAWGAFAQGPQAAGYPTRTVKLLVASAAASSPDAIARMLAGRLTAAWNQPVVIENVPGLGGITGTERGVRQPADGYTLILSTSAGISVGPSIMEKMPYDPAKDLEPVSMVMQLPNLLVVHPSVPAKNLQELIAYVKAHPGKLRYGHPGSGTTPHLSAVLLNQSAGLVMEGIPYKASSQMTTDLLAGHYEVLFHNSSVVLPHAQAGAARIMGITSAERTPALPEVPTVAEAGKLPGFAVSAWWGLYAPAGTPPEIVAKVSADVAAALAHPDLKSWVEKQGGTVGGGTPQALRAFQTAETVKWRDIIKAANIKAE
ncbi:Bug family tripartite tricarboxylate transporter substrate binding protein [Pseudorhodoferax sp.]|uniref:Bug family tripartite tricarboxylate transporter substrate binding protein n=1 Tax=Pseudorhodoferax sp. TaxID=1993553 RepID=UPI002DD6770E|nr:tripartite tricarboxylate transporter substrate-binding protein [Pseudorhodoferax sp.]